MKKEINVLFGIDDSDFSKQALLATGNILKNIEESNLTIFHGASDLNFDLLSQLSGEDPGVAEKHREVWNLEAQKVLEQAEEALIKSGFNQDRLSTHFEKQCKDPAGAMLKLAGQEGIETIAVARWGKETVSRRVIGSVTYRLVQLADNLTVSVIDPRICSYDVLVGLVGTSVSQRIVDYTIGHFAHLKDSRFTLIHVVPPVPPQCLNTEDVVDIQACFEHEKFTNRLKEYTDSVKEIADEAKKKFIKAGVPEQNVILKLQPQKRGIARDILIEMEEGNYGILVIGRKGFRDIREFGLGSKANKLLLSSRAFIVSLVP